MGRREGRAGAAGEGGAEKEEGHEEETLNEGDCWMSRQLSPQDRTQK